MIDQRRAPRVSLEQPIEFSLIVNQVPPRQLGKARDISLGGMFIESNLMCFQGDKVVVHLTLPGRRREMDLPAVIRWTSKDGMGLQFGLLGALDTHEITEFVTAATRAGGVP
jgi:type IV pilus assembly protein PilZ